MKTVPALVAIALSANPVYVRAATTSKEELRVRKVVFEYARCVVQERHDLASRAIIADATNGEITRHYAGLIDSDCLGKVGGDVSVSFGGDLFRYALADALVNQDFAASGPTSFDDRLPLAHILAPDQARLNADLAKTKSASRQKELQRAFDDDFATVWLSRYGECITRKNPADVRLWLLTPPGGPEEISRINSLRPAFSACLQGQQTFNRTTLRGAVALNYYRLAMATSVPAAAQKAN